MNASEIGDAPFLERGELKDEGPLVPRGFLSKLNPEKADIPEGQSGRLQFARWIASEDNPFTARVMANRIWQYHFGKWQTRPRLLLWLLLLLIF